MIVRDRRERRFAHVREKNFAQRDEKANAINGASKKHGTRADFRVKRRRARTNHVQVMQISSMFFESARFRLKVFAARARNAVKHRARVLLTAVMLALSALHTLFLKRQDVFFVVLV